MSEPKPIIGILIIATRKYDVFVKPLLDSIHKYFLIDYDIVAHLFVDKPTHYNGYDRIKIKHHVIPSYGFPFVSLFRYKTFLSFEKEITEDILYYLDADMLINQPVTEEILPVGNGLVSILHPGFFSGGWGSNNTHDRSTSWLPIENRHEYFCGGFQGGTRGEYMRMCKIVDDNIQKDFEIAKEIGYTENNGILCEWHDETAYNFYLKSEYNNENHKKLSPAYCYPESWNIPYEKIILALDKNHNQIRS